MPGDLVVDGDHALPVRRGAHEPRLPGIVDERRITAPAEGIAVLVALRLVATEHFTLPHQAVGNERIGLEDRLSVDLVPCGADEAPLGVHRIHERKPLPLSGSVVVGAEGRGQVHEPRPLLVRHEVAGHDAETLVTAHRHRIEQLLVALSHQVASPELSDARELRQWLPAGRARDHGGLRYDLLSDDAAAVHLVLDVAEVGVHCDAHVRGKRPGRGGPHQEVALLVSDEPEQHEDGRAAVRLVPLCQLVAGQRRTAARAVGQHLVAAVQQVPLVQLFQQPPDALDVLVGVGDVRPRVVKPVADPFGERLPFGLVPEYALLGAAVELGDPEPLDVGLATDVERLLHLDLHRETVRIPSGDPCDRSPQHRVVAADHVLDRPREHVVHAGPAVGCRRPLVEHVGLAVAGRLERAMEEILLAPLLEHCALERVGRAVAERLVRHQDRRSSTPVTSLVRFGSAAAAVAMIVGMSAGWSASGRH